MNRLIYFTVSHNIEYISLLNLCLKSLYDNNYKDDILIITDKQFSREILSRISFQKEPVFLETISENMFDSSSNKLKIYKYPRIKEYDQIIYCDCDIIWTNNPKIIFDLLTEKGLYVGNEDGLMIEDFWGGYILSEKEKTNVCENKILGINAGFFGFNRDSIDILQELDNYCINNKNLMNHCIEQPLFNVYLYRNKNYQIIDKKYIAYNEYKNGCAFIHFLGFPGHFSSKKEKIDKFYKKFNNR